MKESAAGILMGFLVILVAALLAVFYFVNYVHVDLGSQAQATVVVGGKVFSADVASTAQERAQGLSGREGLSDDGGMVFLFGSPGNYGFWMKNMRFPIDIVWIKGLPSQILPGKTWEGKVVGFSENTEAEQGKTASELRVYYPPEPVDKVLELKAGAVSEYGLKVGDGVEVNLL